MEADVVEYSIHAATPGVAVELRSFSISGSGNAKYALWDASNNLVANFGTKTQAATGWNTHSITPLTLADANYALGVAGPGGGVIGGHVAAGSEYYLYTAFSSWTPSDPLVPGDFTAYNAWQNGVQLWGWIAPTITDAPSTIAYNETGFVIAVTDAESAGGKVWFSNSATWGSGTRVEQTPTSWADNSITISCVPGALESGTVHIWIETAHGLYNATSRTVTFTAGPSGNASAGAGETAGNEGAGIASQENAATGNGQTAGSEGGGSSSQAGVATGIGQTPGNEGAGAATQKNTASGAGQTPGSLGSGKEAAPSTGPLVEYTVAEATSGAGTGTVIDNAADPEDLEIVYGGSYPAYVNDANGTGLNFGTARTYGMGAFNGPLDIGHKVFDALNHSKAVTFETVIKLPSAALGGYDIGNHFVVMQDNGYGCECGLWFWEESGSQNFEISFIDQDCTGANFWDHYYIRHTSMASYWGQRVVLHGVIDTANATEEDRIRFYINGTRATLSRTGGHTGINVPQNVEIKITRPTEAPGLDGSTTDAPVYICAGGTPEYHAGSGTMRGEFRHGAIYDAILSEEEIEAHATALIADDDISYVAATYNEAMGVGETAGNEGASVASQSNATAGAGETAGNHGALVASQKNTSTGTCETPGNEGAGVAVQKNASGGYGQTPTGEGYGIGGQENSTTGDGQTPGNEGAGVSAQANVATGEGQTAGNEGIGAGEQRNIASCGAVIPGIELSSVLEQHNNTVVGMIGGGTVVSIGATQQNNASVGIYAPGVLIVSRVAGEENACSVSISIPGIDNSFILTQKNNAICSVIINGFGIGLDAIQKNISAIGMEIGGISSSIQIEQYNDSEVHILTNGNSVVSNLSQRNIADANMLIPGTLYDIVGSQSNEALVGIGIPGLFQRFRDGSPDNFCSVSVDIPGTSGNVVMIEFVDHSGIRKVVHTVAPITTYKNLYSKLDLEQV
jgi:hypothetical protein